MLPGNIPSAYKEIFIFKEKDDMLDHPPAAHIDSFKNQEGQDCGI